MVFRFSGLLSVVLARSGGAISEQCGGDVWRGGAVWCGSSCGAVLLESRPKVRGYMHLFRLPSALDSLACGCVFHGGAGAHVRRTPLRIAVAPLSPFPWVRT